MKKTVGKAQNTVPVFNKLKDPHLFSHQKQHSIKPEVKEWVKSYCTDFSWCEILYCKVQSNNGSIFKADVNQGVLKALAIEYYLNTVPGDPSLQER